MDQQVGEEQKAQRTALEEYGLEGQEEVGDAHFNRSKQ
jgi:hypothetical protein